MIKANNDFLYQIYAIVEEIPQGKVATYGQIAKMAGYDKNSRMVGNALKVSSIYGSFPCHRVVNSSGRLVPGWNEQKNSLIKEGVRFKNETHVDLSLSGWDAK